MKHNFKRLMVLVCMFACLFALTACGEVEDKSIKIDSETKQELIDGSKSDLTFLNTYTDSQLQEMINNETVTAGGATIVKNFLTVCGDLGSFKSIDSSDVTSTEESVVVVVEATYALRKMTYTKTFDAKGNMVSAKFEPYYSFGEKMGKAGMNTLIGMGTVFVVLIGMSFIISLFKYIGAAGTKKTETKKDATAAVDNTIAQIVEKEEAAMDDLELVAVITAAIAASEGTSSDGLVVRSIRKVNKSKWINA